jgi:hypothetical protein
MGQLVPWQFLQLQQQITEPRKKIEGLALSCPVVRAMNRKSAEITDIGSLHFCSSYGFTALKSHPSAYMGPGPVELGA